MLPEKTVKMKTADRKSARRITALDAVILLTVCLALFILILPMLKNAVSETKALTVIESYETELGGEHQEALQHIKEETGRYNEAICEEQSLAPFSYRGAEATDEWYESVPGTNDSGVIGYIDIPEVGIYLPVLHGTGDEVLRSSCGHMYGTSIPSGGESTHAVITGHTGLTQARLFTDLIDLETGDLVKMHIMGEVHVYVVEAINVVLPGKESPYLQVEPGKDLITLYTCTPYGINDHRLLVRCRRDKSREQLTSSDTGGAGIGFRSFRACLAVLALSLLPLTPLLIAVAKWLWYDKYKYRDMQYRKNKRTGWI